MPAQASLDEPGAPEADARSTDHAQLMPRRDRAADQARWIARPEMLTAAQFSERFRLALTTIDHRRRAGQLLGLRPDGTRKTLRYPAWQGKMIAEAPSRQFFESILKVLGPVEPWRTYEFFVSPSSLLADRTPIDVWRMDIRDALLQAAQRWSLNGM